MTDVDEILFSRGGSAAIETDEQLSAGRKGSYRKFEYFENPGKGNFIFLRYLTEEPDWIYATVHSGLPTKNKPADWPEGGNWPKIMTPVCRYDKVFKKDRVMKGLAPYFADCYPCDTQMQNGYGKVSNPVVRVWALAVLREEVIATEEIIAAHNLDPAMLNKRVGFKDATRKVAILDSSGKPTEQFTVEPRIVIVNRPIGNFFQGLQSLAGVYGSICDRDFLVKQNNEGKDIDFTHAPLDPDGLKPGTEQWGRYTQAIKDQELNLDKLVFRNADDEFYALFIDPTKAPPARKTKDGSQETSTTADAPRAQQSAAPSNEPSAEDLAKMRERVRGLSSAFAPSTGSEKSSGPSVDFSQTS